jgi:hypothetical protein
MNIRNVPEWQQLVDEHRSPVTRQVLGTITEAEAMRLDDVRKTMDRVEMAVTDGTSPASVTVERCGDTFRTIFAVGVQSFVIAEGDDVEAEEHCWFIRDNFVKALIAARVPSAERMLTGEARAAWVALEVAMGDLWIARGIPDMAYAASGPVLAAWLRCVEHGVIPPEAASDARRSETERAEAWRRADVKSRVRCAALSEEVTSLRHDKRTLQDLIDYSALPDDPRVCLAEAERIYLRSARWTSRENDHGGLLWTRPGRQVECTTRDAIDIQRGIDAAGSDT